MNTSGCRSARKSTFRAAALPLQSFGCRSIDNTKQAYRIWFRRSGSELGRLAINRFFWEHDGCQSFAPGEARYIEKIADWNGDGSESNGQLVCLGAYDFDPSPPDDSRAPAPKSPCFWAALFMPPTILPASAAK